MKSRRILELYPDAPLSTQLLNFIDTHTDFEQSLKLSAYPRFIYLQGIICSYPNEDEVLGMFYYDQTSGIFKQDYVVNVGFHHKVYVSYTKRRKDVRESAHAKSLDDFFEIYGKWDGHHGEFFCKKNNQRKPWMHHYDKLNDLPTEIQPYAKLALRTAYNQTLSDRAK